MTLPPPTPRRSTPGASAPADTRRRVAAARATAIVRVDSDLAARAVAARAQRQGGVVRTAALQAPTTASRARSVQSRRVVEWPVTPLQRGGVTTASSDAASVDATASRSNPLSRIAEWLRGRR